VIVVPQSQVEALKIKRLALRAISKLETTYEGFSERAGSCAICLDNLGPEEKPELKNENVFDKQGKETDPKKEEGPPLETEMKLDRKIVRLKCGENHIFHSACIKLWVEKQT